MEHLANSDQSALDVHELLKHIIESLVDEPACVKIECQVALDSTVFRVNVAPADIGKVIGRQGRTARSIRVILAAASMKMRRRFALDIVEDDVSGPREKASTAEPPASSEDGKRTVHATNLPGGYARSA